MIRPVKKYVNFHCYEYRGTYNRWNKVFNLLKNSKYRRLSRLEEIQNLLVIKHQIWYRYNPS